MLKQLNQDTGIELSSTSQAGPATSPALSPGTRIHPPSSGMVLQTPAAQRARSFLISPFEGFPGPS